METVKTNIKTELTFMEFCEKKKTDYSEFFDLEMCDENKTWKVVYHNNKNGYFPERIITTKRGKLSKNIEQKHLFHSINLYCEERGLYLQGYGNCVSDSGYVISWRSKHFGFFPYVVFPKKILRFFDNVKYLVNRPFYEDKDYKKYIEDNNGDCPLPLPNLDPFNYPINNPFIKE